jgi:hypothetical protein
VAVLEVLADEHVEDYQDEDARQHEGELLQFHLYYIYHSLKKWDKIYPISATRSIKLKRLDCKRHIFISRFYSSRKTMNYRLVLALALLWATLQTGVDHAVA